MPNFDATIPEKQNDANKISQAAKAFLDAAEAYKAAAYDLASNWEGDSQVAFLAEQEKAIQWSRKMVKIVQTYVTSLNNAAKTGQKADEASDANIRDQ